MHTPANITPYMVLLAKTAIEKRSEANKEEERGGGGERGEERQGWASQQGHLTPGSMRSALEEANCVVRHTRRCTIQSESVPL